MTQEQLYILLLKNAIGQSEIDLPIDDCSVDWHRVLNYCTKQGTASLVYDQVLQLPKANRPNEDVCNQMKQMCLQNMLLQQQYAQLLKQAVASLQSNGIQPVLLKGFALAQLYPLPYLRQWGDMDIYVGDEQYHQACAVLRNTFPDAKHPPMEYEELKHYNFDFPNGLAIETHRTTMVFANKRDNRIWKLLEQEGTKVDACEKITVEGVEVLCPEKKFNLLFVFVHAWQHYMETGMPMKQLCDMALLCKTHSETVGLDDYLRTNLKKLRLMTIWQAVGYNLVNHLGLDKVYFPLYDDSLSVQQIAERMWSDTMTHGQGRAVAQVPNYLRGWNTKGVMKRKIYTFVQRMSELKVVWKVDRRYAMRLWMAAVRKGIGRIFRKDENVQWGVMVKN